MDRRIINKPQPQPEKKPKDETPQETIESRVARVEAYLQVADKAIGNLGQAVETLAATADLVTAQSAQVTALNDEVSKLTGMQVRNANVVQAQIAELSKVINTHAKVINKLWDDVNIPMDDDEISSPPDDDTALPPSDNAE
jgi:hypothetical protein